MKRIAANRILINPETLLLNAVVELDDAGVVRRIFELSECNVEPSHTRFFNGLITTFVPKETRKVGVPVPKLAVDSLAVGYNGNLLLWQNLSAASLKIALESTITEL